MGSKDAAEIDLWLRDGGLVVAANERAARAVAAAFHRARRAEGLEAWPAPNIQDWRSFVRGGWQTRCLDDRLTLNALQEESLWTDIVGATGAGETLLAAPRHRMATLAMEAHELLCDFAPELLNERARSSWRQDAEAFSDWLAEFERRCSSDGLMSAARLPLELLRLLEDDAEPRPALLLVGFDRVLPVQRKVLDAWGAWREAPLGEPAAHPRFCAASDAQSELAACALWCKDQLARNPHAHLLVVAQNVGERRGAIERAFSRFAGGPQLFEFSLGVPLSQVALVRAARLVLHWFSDAIEEHELDWLISTEQTADAAESEKLAALMRAVRRRGWEQPDWRLDDFLRQRPGAEMPPAWAARMTQARRTLEKATKGSAGAVPEGRTADPFIWAELVPQLLEAAGWPGARAQTSAEFQAMQRWQRALDECASLGFNGRRVSWREFLPVLGEALDAALFAPESRNAPIQIAGPAESAGLTADGVWFLGAAEDSWPAPGATHPLLPFGIQRETAMPHSSPQLDWDVSRSVTRRLLASGTEVHFSFARQDEGIEMRPSRLIAQLAGPPEPMPAEFLPPLAPAPIAVEFQDFSRIPLATGHAPGGSSVLTAQSQCAFKAFAIARLGAESWEPAQAGLTAPQRGQLLHAVLHSIWAGPPVGIRSHRELLAIGNRRAFVEGHVRNALRTALPAGVLHRLSPRYLELEQTRLIGLVEEWLAFEASRIPFSVASVETEASPSIAGLGLHLRFDRIDQLADGSLLVIDYKTGNIAPKAWELPRPDDVQLPLYAIFGLDEDLRAQLTKDSRDAAATIDAESEGRLGGLLFAKVRAGEHCFEGRMGDAKAVLLSDLHASNALVKIKFTAEELMEWREYIEQMAENFLAGRADVDPRQYPKTCERCDLRALCRIEEDPARMEEADSEEACDE